MITARALADHLDTLLGVPGFPDYPPALNGLQLDHRGPVRRVATAVDFSRQTITAARDAGANFLVLHHGMFWGGNQRLTGAAFGRLHELITQDIAVYAVHLPLDAHETLGNCALMAKAVGLQHTARFGDYQGVKIGVAGECDLPTSELLARARVFSAALGGEARASALDPERRTRRWAVITGAGADSGTIREAATRGIDTLIVGEGAHHTTVDAPEHDLAIIYAGHYATETLGVQALAHHIGRECGVPAEFLFLPTGS